MTKEEAAAVVASLMKYTKHFDIDVNDSYGSPIKATITIGLMPGKDPARLVAAMAVLMDQEVMF